jgi:septal ring factor EnvC (AmiA/AmiB activator)
VDIYKSNTTIKKEEEDQLQKVLSEYKSKFAEFDKSTKQSRKTLGQYEKDLGAMNRKVDQLQEQRMKVIKAQVNKTSLSDALDDEPAKGGGKNKKKRGKNVNVNANADPELMAKEYDAKMKAEMEK